MLKIKGFTLNYQNSKRLNIDSMKQIINKEVDRVNLSYKMITRDVKNKTLVNKETTKTFKLQYDKRNTIPEKDCIIETLPWGY